MPRDERVRLTAATALLDRGGVVAPRTPGDGGGDGGPAIVLPPGTRMSILATTEPAQDEGVERPAPAELRVTRGDELAQRLGMGEGGAEQ